MIDEGDCGAIGGMKIKEKLLQLEYTKLPDISFAIL
jgi:hypothetical protein